MPSATITVDAQGNLTGPSPMPGWLTLNDSTSSIDIAGNGSYTLTFSAASSSFNGFTWTSQTNAVTYTSVSSTLFTISDSNPGGPTSTAGAFTVNIGSQSVDPTIVNNPG